MSINNITQPLINLVQIHKQLVNVSEKKTEIIKDGAVDKLQQILALETKLIQKLEQVETERQENVEQWFRDHGRAEEEQTITKILELLEDETEVAKLEKTTITLTNTIAKLKQQEQLNINLLQQSMQFVQLSLDLLSPTIKNMNYSGEKDIGTKQTDRSIFDSKA